MPWLFTIPEFVKKRACRYLLQHYLGQYLEEKIQLEDLTVDLYNGTGTITNVPLNVEAINESLEGSGAPVQVVSGYLGRVTISVPWSALMSDSCRVEVTGLTLSVMPCVGSSPGDDFTTMTDSLFFRNMSNSMQMAEEVLKSGPVDGERRGAGEEGEGRAAFEGMEALAKAIETVLSRVQIDLRDTVVQVVYRSLDYTHQYFVRVKIQSTRFYDELRGGGKGRGGGESGGGGGESSVDGPGQDEAESSGPAAVATKILELSHISVEVGGGGEDVHTSTLSPEELPGVPVACAGGDVSVRVRVRGVEGAPVPRVHVEAVVGRIHCLLAPAQMHILTEMANNLSGARGSTSSDFKQISTGVNRPIPGKDLRNIESQLRHHFHEERRHKEHRGDLLRADPYQNVHRGAGGSRLVGMTDSSVTSADMFYSLNLHDSFSEASRSETGGERSMESSLCTTAASSTMGDSYISTAHSRRKSPDSLYSHWDRYSEDSISLGGGSGLQQLAHSPGMKQRDRSREGVPGTSQKGIGGGGARGGITQQDVCKYSLTLSGVTVAVLEANPTYTHPAGEHHSKRGNTDQPSAGSYSSLDSSGLDPTCYLSEVADVLRDGVNRREILRNQERLAQALPLDHLFLWLSTVKAGVSMQGPHVDLQLTVASCELWEFLYSNAANLPHITTPVSAVPLVELSEDVSLSRPCVRLKVSSTTETSRKRLKQGPPDQLTSVDLSLTSPHVNLDPTLAERLQPLLHSSLSVPRRTGVPPTSQPQLKHSLYMTTSNFQSINTQRQAVFNQAVSSDHQTSHEQRVNVKMTTSSVSLTLRFPVPELSESQRRLPWYHPSLRQEVLHVNLSHLTLTTTLHPHHSHNTAAVYDAHFTHADVYLSCDGSVEGRELFLTVRTGGEEQASPFGATDGSRANVQLVVQSVNGSALEQLNKFSAHSSHPHTHTPSHPHMLYDLGMGLGMEREVPCEPSPFSTKKDMYSGKGGTQGADEDSASPQEHTEHLVTPGNRSEMEEFEQFSSSLSQHHVSLHLPHVCVHLPSKRFLEALYSRFATDLALWRPASPEQVERANVARSLFFSSADIQPAATAEEKVQMFKSVLRECSEKEELDEDEEGDDLAQEFLPSPPSSPPSPAGLSLLALSVSVDSALLSMVLSVEESKSARVSSSHSRANDSPHESLYASALLEPPLLDIDSEGGEGEGEGAGGRGGTEREEDHGLAVVELSTLHFYLVSGYHGDPNHDYVCAYVNQFSLSHTGSLRSSALSQFSAVLDSSHHSSLSQLHHIVQRSPDRLQMKPTPRGVPLPPMILIAMDIRLEPERNSKTNKCAVALQSTLINHHITLPAHNCFKQLGDFLSLSEQVVEGYDPPSLITEMHLHLQDLQLEYCPLHLPLTALLSVSSVQLSTSLVVGSPLLVVRVLVDHTHLALSNTRHQPPSLSEDYVCVLDLDWFELTLRLCNTAQFEEESQKLFSHLPDISLECSSNVLQIHTCVDSCIALRDLLIYLASDGDLRPRPTAAREDNSSRAASLGSYSAGAVTSLSTTPPSPLPSSHAPSSELDIGDLISEAIDDSPPLVTSTQAPPTSGGGRYQSSVAASGLRVGGSPHVSGGECVAAESGSTEKTADKNRMQVVECDDEKLIDIDFGDSEEEEEEEKEEENGQRLTATTSRSGGLTASVTVSQGVGGGTRGTAAGRRGGGGEGGREEDSDDDGFCILDAPTSTYVAPGSKPVVKCLLPDGEVWRIVENHFAIPERHVDQLQRPKHFPEPVLQYTLKELTIVWHLYGGHDFPTHPPSSGSTPHSTTSSGSHSNYGAPSSNSRAKTNTTAPGSIRPHPLSSGSTAATYSSTSSGHPHTLLSAAGSGMYVRGGGGGGGGGKGMGKKGSPGAKGGAGGTGRDHSVHMEVEVDKLRLQFETFPPDSCQASRLAFLVRDLEIRDRLVQSNINKFLYQCNTESMPRQSHANMVSLKVLNTRPEPEVNPSEEEVSIRLSILPIRLNIDQDSFYFLFEFFSQVSDTSSLQPSPPSHSLPPSTTEAPSSSQAATAGQGQVFIRSFVFQPALPIRIDYTTKWRFPTDTMGTLPGILISLYHLDNSELTLKSLNCKTGFLGWDSLVECVTREWTTDIMSRQLPLILKGVGPTHYITQFVHGVVDLVRLPYHQYHEDGRIVWGLQQGASSFSTSTGVAVVELTSRTLETLQSVAQMVYDLVTPVPVDGQGSQALGYQRRAPHQPQDFREGVANAYDVVTAGLTGTAVDLYAVASQEHEERGMTGAVGGILRQIPGTVVKPVILLSEATRHVLGGVKNQFVPDARREAKEKWKTLETSD